MYPIVGASRPKHEKSRLLGISTLLPYLKLLLVSFVTCAVISHILHVFRAQRQKTKNEIPQDKRLPACKINIKDLGINFNSSLEYQCDLFCKTLGREARLQEAEFLNEGLTKQNNGLAQNKSRVLIVSYKRSGSSFLGEIFNRHQDVFYLFEPLHSLALVGKEGTAIYYSMIKHLLRVILSCQFAEHPYYVGYSNYGYFRARSRVLSQGCISGWRSRPEKTLICENIDPKSMSSLCESHQHIALKTIRIRSFDTLKSVLNSMKTTRILHLVRDPRAVINSRRKLNKIESSDYKSEESARKSSRELCQEMLKKLEQGASMRGWSGDYHVVRYEDVAARPIFAIKELYDYVGIKPSQDVFEWISKNTNAEKETHSFSTTKNATISINRWKVDLDLNTIRVIEEECREVMHVLGYKLIGNRLAKNGMGIHTSESTLDVNHVQGLFVTKAVENTVLKNRVYQALLKSN